MQEQFGLDTYPEEINVEFPEVLYAKFEALCDQKGLSKDEVIRTLVDDFVEHHAGDQPMETDEQGQLEAF